MPLLVISRWARRNYVDGTFTEQSSATRFIEENWNLGKIGGGSEDASSGTLDNMFDFDRSDARSPSIPLNDETGEVQSEGSSGEAPAEGAKKARKARLVLPARRAQLDPLVQPVLQALQVLPALPVPPAPKANRALPAAS